MLEIEKRIESLERTNRRWRRMAGLFAVLLLIALTGSANPPASIPDVLRAKRIEVIAPDGKPVIVLNADSNSSGIGLSAQGQGHKGRIVLSADREGVHLFLMKHAEAPLFMANVDDSGSSLSLFDGRERGRNRSSITLSSIYSTEVNLGATSINLRKGTAKGNAQAGLSIVENDNAASLSLGGDDGKMVNVRVDQKDGKVRFLGENDKVIFTTP